MKRTTLHKVLVLLSVIGCCAGRIIVQPASVPETSAPTQVTTANTQQSETAKAESGSIGLLGQAGAGGAGVAGVAAAVTSTVDSAAAANTTTVNETITAGPESAVAANGAPAQPPVETAAEAAQKPVARHPKIPMPAAGQHYKFEKVPQAAARPKPAAVVPGDAELGKLLNGTAFIPGACGPKPSSLGYQCSWAGPNGIVLHWSYNVSHPPINRCTTNNALPNAEARNNVTWLGDMGIHFALQVATKEKLHLGFIEPRKHRYYPTDGVHTGTYCSGADCNPKTPQVEVSYYANPSLKVVTGNRALRDPSIMEGWAAWASSDFDDLTGVLCFSRRANGTQLKVAGTVGSEVLMAYAVNSRTPYTYRAPRLGMVRVNFKTGSAAVVTVPNGAIRAHGALMLLAFAVLLPAGLLTSRHSWMFVDDKKETGLSPIWALVHMGLLALGALLALAGMIVALVAFGNTGLNAANSTHKVLGLIAVALILLLVVLHGLRPLVVTAPGQLSPLVVPLKAAGVLTIASSWATLFIGCVVARDFYAVPLSSWVPPCAILCGLVTMVAIALELRYQKLVRTGAYNPKTHVLSNLNPLPLARIRTHREPTNSKKDEFLAPNQPYSDEFMPESNAGVAKSPMKAMGLGAKGPLVHIMAAAQGRSSSTSSGGSTPSSVTYRGRTSTASMPGNITGFPSHPGARMSENV